MRGRGRHAHGRHAGGSILMAPCNQPAAVPGSSAAAAADDSDDDELAEFKREAAQLMQKARQQQHLPAGLNPATMASAAKQLHGLGVSKDDADAALLAVFEEHGGNFDEWLEEAQVWLAVRAEADTEAEKLKEAMEVSLQEQAERRATEQAAAPPLVNLSEDRLRRRFAGSAVLPCLERCMPGSVLFSDASPMRELIKFKLVDLLRLESDCCRWYPNAATQQYFGAFGERCVEQIISTRCSCSQIQLEAVKPEQQQQQVQQPKEQLPATLLQQVQPSAEQQRSAGQGVPQQAQHQISVSSERGAADTHRCGGFPTAAQVVAAVADGSAATATDITAAGLAVEPSSRTAGAADADHCGLKRSNRRRQCPSRYRSPSPTASETTSGASKASKGSRKRTPTPEAATGQAKAAHTAGATCVASSRASSSDRTAMLPPPVRMSPDSNAAPAVVHSSGMPAVVDLQQKQQQSHPHQRLADLSSALGQHPAVIMRLSHVLEQEHKAVQDAIYAMPDTSGAVPEIFKGKLEAAGEQDGSDSELEVVQEISASAAASKATGRRQTCSDAFDELTSTAAVPPAEAAAAPPAAGSQPHNRLPPAAQSGMLAASPAPAVVLAAAAAAGNGTGPAGPPMPYGVPVPNNKSGSSSDCHACTHGLKQAAQPQLPDIIVID